MTHRLNLLLVFLALVVGVPFYWVFLQNPARSTPPRALTIVDLRRLAAEAPGPVPTAIGFVGSGWKRVPGNLYAAGSGMKRRLLVTLTYRIDLPGLGPVVVDPGTTEAMSEAVGMEHFQGDQQARIDEWVRQASIVLATSERPLHLAGLAAFAGRAGSLPLLARARLNAWQVPGAAGRAGVSWPQGLVLRPAIAGTAPQAIARGIVVIPTGLPSPGSQMVYVRLANGREYILAGDMAPFHVNASELRVRAQIMDRHLPPEKRQGMMRWLITLRRLTHEAPGLAILPGHDADWLIGESEKTGVQPL